MTVPNFSTFYIRKCLREQDKRNERGLLKIETKNMDTSINYPINSHLDVQHKQAINHPHFLLAQRESGYIVEYVLVIYVVVFLLALPAIDLCTVGLRSASLLAATRDAAYCACRAKSLVADVSSSDVSAAHVAQSVALADVASCTGVSVDSVNTYLLTTNVSTLVMTRQQSPLTQAPNTSLNVYQIEVVVAGRIRPLLLFNSSAFGNVPGLTQWIPLTFRSTQICEYPQGLTM